MRFIGITGGVGAGKSELLHYIEREFSAKILLADELAHKLMQPGTECYAQIREAFPDAELYLETGSLHTGKLAAVIFSDAKKRDRLNGIVHPAVKQEILRLVEEERQNGVYSYFILEAALLIEDGYDQICDELWYICTSKEKRRSRLKESRGYSDEKIDAVFASQISEEKYRRYCKVVINNNGTLEESFHQIRNALKASSDREAKKLNYDCK